VYADEMQNACFIVLNLFKTLCNVYRIFIRIGWVIWKTRTKTFWLTKLGV